MVASGCVWRQVCATLAVVAYTVMAVTGVSGPAAIVLGGGLALSSTAVAMQVPACDLLPSLCESRAVLLLMVCQRKNSEMAALLAMRRSCKTGGRAGQGMAAQPSPSSCCRCAPKNGSHSHLLAAAPAAHPTSSAEPQEHNPGCRTSRWWCCSCSSHCWRPLSLVRPPAWPPLPRRWASPQSR